MAEDIYTYDLEWPFAKTEGYLDPDALTDCLDVRCSRCGVVGTDVHYSEMIDEIDDIWKGRRFPGALMGFFCPKCVTEILPHVWKLRDVDELSLYVNKLKRVINETLGTQNNRANARTSRKRNQGGNERGSSHRPSHRTPQIIEERNRLAVFGVEDCDVSALYQPAG